MTAEHRLFIVDDDAEDQLIILEFLKEIHQEQYVKFFVNGKETLEYLDACPDSSKYPHLIVLDLNMPVLNGTQTLMQLKRDVRFKDIPVIIFSTSENETEKRKCLSFGALEYIIKPSTYDEGMRIVTRFRELIGLTSQRK